VAFDVRTKIYSAPSLGPIPIGPLPLVGALYSFLIWPVIWALTEVVTYLGYVLPRLNILTGRMSIAFVMVVFFWSVHTVRCRCASISVSCSGDQSILCRSSRYSFLILIRTRRLQPLIVAHWTADALAVLATALLPALRH